MSENWRTRLLLAIQNSPLTRAEIARRADISKAFFRDVFERNGTPNVDTLAKVANALGTTLSQLYDGDERKELQVTVKRFATSDVWTELPDGEARVIALPILDQDYVAVELGNSPPSGYRKGDVLCGSRTLGRHIDNLVGRECIVTTDDGHQVVRFVQRGTKPGRYTLRSGDPATPDIPDARVAWAAPITFILRT